MKNKTKKQARQTRKYRIRAKINGTDAIPRISIYKSNINFYVQLISDESHKTITSSSTLILKLKSNSIENVKKVAKDFAKKSKAKKIEKVVFDRSGYIYHGKIKAFANTLREEGLKF